VSSAVGLENNDAISFSGGSLPSGIVAGTVYWIGNLSGNTFEIYSDFAVSSVVTLSGSGTGTFSTFSVGTPGISPAIPNGPTYFAYATTQNSYWCVDGVGQVWTNQRVTATGNWVYTGNKLDPFSQGGNANGNGLGYYESSTQVGYIFVFRNGGIDYTPTATVSWNYGWNPASASNNTSSNYLNTPVGTNNPHYTLVGQDNVFYYCDSNFLGSWFEKPGQTFSPTSGATYTFAKQALELPVQDNANCLAELGVNLLVGGQRNAVYPWDRTSTSFTYPILLAENYIQKMVTVNTNTYIFVGNRGRIYITNSSQAQLFMKIPDHISGTVEPYFQWGGVASSKNQLYFSAQCFTNADSAITAYGGLWAIDLDTNALRLVNKLSYGTYAGYATAITPIFQPLGAFDVSTPSGTGLWIGWNSGASTYGIDGTSSTIYTGGQSVIASDLIPVGTFLKPMTPYQFEYKLSVPLKTGESVQILAGSSLADYTGGTMTSVFTTNGDGIVVSDNSSNHLGITVQNQQWLIVQAILTGIASNPSYNRITQIRVIGDTTKTQIAGQPYGTQ
ncbi:MAG TPA: hypothetical protein VNZ86_03175, partial [Bacteroidia bacterium]|nr:hypothetical protein [Bacteroidia bacterium]